MFPIHETAEEAIEAIAESFPDVAVLLRSEIREGRPSDGLEREGGAAPDDPEWTPDEQLSLVTASVRDLIVNPARAGLVIPIQLDALNVQGADLVFPEGGRLDVDLAFYEEASVQAFEETFNAFIDELRRQLDSPGPQPGSGGPGR